jgi:tetraacyldisaccharide 4'-kinase
LWTVRLAEIAESVWYGDALSARIARAILTPASAVFGVVSGRMHASYDQSPPTPGGIPAISIGNLTVGGTGKTPVSAWFARRLRDAGATPAIVMRGYGADESLVHHFLNPDVPVYANADRASGVTLAALRGADVAILDDAFQHRRAARAADVVLVSADRWTGEVRLLPAGPFREPMSALRRATLVLLTVKAASPERVRIAEAAIRSATSAPVVTVDLAPASFVNAVTGGAEPLERWRGRRVLVVSGIGDPASFHAQLERIGMQISALVFDDHHQYDGGSMQRICAAAAGQDAVICTLKDAVKLAPLLTSSDVPVWYLSQSVVPRDGAEELDAVVQSMLMARRNDHSLPDLSR